MSNPRLSAVLISAALSTAALLGAASYASAQVVIPTNRNALIQQNELQTLRNQLQRQQFQQQQQLYREQDRQILPKPRPEVPVVKQNCQSQVIGTTISRVCR
ncbi:MULTISPECIES: hypothetical protein [unclassified Mesorhizobium]|uniref:hypothetical protein n=1 Tax=unclassified Mesorhizobium TaxID=325217 RepID=UPI000FCB8653|nr:MULTISPECIES: hypothetical protein [unclassified Mesorhizobium]TIT76327.1 MAG: hypothetical protein E5W57_19410 [Mesorhizobium sp.]TGP23614.1 hypothetical protein EN874_013835 [Mesorhizobium sp. M1D.F.Ca.ET.231.01.1.1]TGP33758.1 hypothetical protein EN877_13840 [Mesorhizobium sp. M1D.F.Ca.ET.234.01.1.1]TGS47124.1 hypothetical protein EN827_13835 [Mesorhizobium sp. M1D.F.Ca.ET.184.01.1.1]TGS62382.1 hypothetical protein EN826_013835 [Mesorhizobium sp. M1D.F.Ca.ET.183.01.1.1]